MEKIVIVGAGFAGIMAAKQLVGLKNVQTTILSEKDHFLFTPRLTELLNESVNEKIVVKKLSEIFRGKASVLQEKVIQVNLEKRTIKTQGKEMEYDYLILSPGSITNFFGNDKLRQNTIDYKDYAAMIRIKHKMKEEIQRAAAEKRQATFAVIGGGFTGVELIASLREASLREATARGLESARLKFILIQGANSIMPALAQKPRLVVERYLTDKGIEVKTSTVVEDIEEGTITTKQGEKIHADLIVWCAGITAQVIETRPEIKLEKNNCIAITPTGQVPLFDEVYVIGDAGLCINEDMPLPPTAQVAFQEGVAIGKNIKKKIKNEAQKPFKYHHKGTLIVLGHDFGIFTLGPITIKGRLAWLLRDLIYRVRFWQLT